MTAREAKVQMAIALRNAVGVTLDDMEPLEKLEAGLTNGFEYQFCNNPFTATVFSLRMMRTFNRSVVWTVSLRFHFWAHPSDQGPRPLGCVPEALALAEAAITAAQAMPCIDDDE